MTDTDSRLALAGGTVFDSDARTFAAGRDFVAVGGRFVEAPLPGMSAGVDLLDCQGCYVIPGLIDCHVHLAYAGSGDEESETRDMSPALRALRAAGHAEATLKAGFTLVRDLGAPARINIDLARAVDRGLVAGPAIMAAGLGVTMTGGHGYTTIAREADGPDEVRKAVREQLRAGATAIKLFASGGVMTPGIDPRSPSFTEDELRAGVEEAHKAFRVVGAHAQSSEGIKNAIRAGVDSIEHGIWLDQEAIEMMVEHGAYLVPTITAPSRIAAGGADAGIPAFMLEKNLRVIEDHIASYRAAVKAGVRLAAGTDQGTPMNRPGENAQELVLMAEYGLSNAAALLAGTQWAADLLGVGHERGRLAPGYIADAIVLAADPLGDLSALSRPENVVAVVKDGRIAYHKDGGTS